MCYFHEQLESITDNAAEKKRLLLEWANKTDPHYFAVELSDINSEGAGVLFVLRHVIELNDEKVLAAYYEAFSWFFAGALRPLESEGINLLRCIFDSTALKQNEQLIHFLITAVTTHNEFHNADNLYADAISVGFDENDFSPIKPKAPEPKAGSDGEPLNNLISKHTKH